MSKNNYIQLFNKTINSIENQNQKPRLLLHACCAPCSCGVLPRLVDFFDITLLYFNPCITDKIEYNLRAENLRILAEKAYPFVKLKISEYKPNIFYDAIIGNENEKEGGARCKICIAQRIEETAKIAKENKYDYFCTTLSVSPHKNADYINEIGESMANNYKIKWLPSDFKKENGFKISVDESKRLGIYRQEYCGCEFSKNK